MCGVSGPELIVIVVAAVIILGPERLPEVMRAVGRLLREVRRLTGDLGKMTDDVRGSVSVDELKRQLREEMGLERARERRREVESEIDEIRARLRAKVEASEGPTSVEARELKEKFGSAAAAATIEPPAPDVGSAPAEIDDDPLPPPATVRPAARSVAADEPPPVDDAAPATDASDTEREDG